MGQVHLNELYDKELKMHHFTKIAYPLTSTSFMDYKELEIKKFENC